LGTRRWLRPGHLSRDIRAAERFRILRASPMRPTDGDEGARRPISNFYMLYFQEPGARSRKETRPPIRAARWAMVPVLGVRATRRRAGEFLVPVSPRRRNLSRTGSMPDKAAARGLTEADLDFFRRGVSSVWVFRGGHQTGIANSRSQLGADAVSSTARKTPPAGSNSRAGERGTWVGQKWIPRRVRFGRGAFTPNLKKKSDNPRPPAIGLQQERPKEINEVSDRVLEESCSSKRLWRTEQT